MRRRDLIAAGTAVALSAPVIAASPALASESKKPEDAAEPVAKTVNIGAVGLPVIVDNRIRNYVFVTLTLHLSAETTVDLVRTKEQFFRDALVRTAHGAPFTQPDDWNVLSENKISAAMVAIAGVIIPHAVTGARILNQVPRRRISTPAAPMAGTPSTL